MSEEFSGGCECGAVRYVASEAPVMSHNCYCRHCQRATGTGHAPIMVVRDSAFDLRGEPKCHTLTADRGHDMQHYFCGDCGCPVFFVNTAYPMMRAILAGSLDDPSIFKPQREFYRTRAHDWDAPDMDIEGYDKLPDELPD